MKLADWMQLAGFLGFAGTEEEEAATADGVGAGAGEVGSGGDSAEQDEPVPECTPEALGFTHRESAPCLPLIQRKCVGCAENGTVSA